jgi:glycosyltransferase involved in cell wall biosynthesis
VTVAGPGGGARHVTFFDAYPHVLGGAQRMMALAAERLPERGWATDFVLPGDGAVADRLREGGVPTSIVPVPPSLGRYGRTTTGLRAAAAAAALPRYWLRLARTLRAHQGPVHIDDHRGLVLAGPAARLARRPIVWHIHGIDRSRSLNAMGGRLADRVIVPSRLVVAGMAGIEHRRPVAEVRYCVEPGRWAETRTDAGPLVVTVGRLHPDKGYDVLLHAVAEVRGSVPDVRVVIAGGAQDGYEDHHRSLIALRSELGLDDVVELAGFVPRPVDLLAAAAVYVQSSREQTELLPIAVIEALASGAAVVSTRVGAVEALVRDGEDGLLVEPGDVEGLGDALRSLLLDPSFAGRLGRAAAARAKTDFDPDAMVAGLAEVYDDLGRRGSRGG